MNVPATQNTSLPATKGDVDPYAGNDFFGVSNIVGHLLRFNKFGEWRAGQDNVLVPMGTRVIVHMGDVLIGWQRWQDNKPVEQIMGFLRDNFQVPDRDTLSHTDTSKWEIDADGNERDPWQQTCMLIFKGADDDELYTFSTSAKGAIRAVGDLCRAYAAAVKMRPGHFPIVELSWGTFTSAKHPEWGEMRKPAFKIVDWINRKVMDDALAGADQNQEQLPFQGQEPETPKQSYADASGANKAKRNTRF